MILKQEHLEIFQDLGMSFMVYGEEVFKFEYLGEVQGTYIKHYTYRKIDENDKYTSWNFCREGFGSFIKSSKLTRLVLEDSLEYKILQDNDII